MQVTNSKLTLELLAGKGVLYNSNDIYHVLGLCQLFNASNQFRTRPDRMAGYCSRSIKLVHGNETSQMKMMLSRWFLWIDNGAPFQWRIQISSSIDCMQSRDEHKPDTIH